MLECTCPQCGDPLAKDTEVYDIPYQGSVVVKVLRCITCAYEKVVEEALI